MLWILTSLGASVIWGLTYVLDGKLYERGISVPFLIAAHTFFVSICLFLVALVRGEVLESTRAIVGDTRLLLYFALCTCAFAAAEYLIGTSIAHKNATVAALIEISYPLFTLLWAYVLFAEVQVNAGALVGGVLILIGTGVIAYSAA